MKRKRNFVFWSSILLLILIGLIMIFLKPAYDNSQKENNSTGQILAKVHCSNESRSAQVCSEIYAPVCGYPLKQTFSNSCFACIKDNVIYYTNGQCMQ